MYPKPEIWVIEDIDERFLEIVSEDTAKAPWIDRIHEWPIAQIYNKRSRAHEIAHLLKVAPKMKDLIQAVAYGNWEGCEDDINPGVPDSLRDKALSLIAEINGCTNQSKDNLP